MEFDLWSGNKILTAWLGQKNKKRGTIYRHGYRLISDNEVYVARISILTNVYIYVVLITSTNIIFDYARLSKKSN